MAGWSAGPPVEICSAGRKSMAGNRGSTRELLEAVSAGRLEADVRALAVPRHAMAEPEANRAAAGWIERQLQSIGWQVTRQGECGNLIALPAHFPAGPGLLAADHYDSAPRSPGAADIASALAPLLACARLLAVRDRPVSAVLVVFNREEDCQLGSDDFVKDFLPHSELQVAEAHVLEMVGYCRREAGSQRRPPGLPVRVPDRGDFLGLVGNRRSAGLVDAIMEMAPFHAPGLSIAGLKVYLGLERYLPHLRRSDHAPFWEARIPAVMWTDTADFRNPHYHQPSDTPETLDYAFLSQVTRLLLGRILDRSAAAPGGRG